MEQQYTQCGLCRGALRERDLELTYDFGDLLLVVRGVPGQVCDACQGQFVPGPIGVALGELIPQIAQQLRAVSAQIAAIRRQETTITIDKEQLLQSATGYAAAV